MTAAEFINTTANLLDIIGRVGAALTVVGGIVAFAFKHAIGEWIKARFSTAVEKELDVHKHELQRELEAYKVSLMRDLEKVRANIDIQRSIALKMADARLAAIRALVVRLDDFCTECSAWACSRSDVRQQVLADWNESSEAVRQARLECEVFLPRQLLHDVVDCYASYADLVADYPVGREEVLTRDTPRLRELGNKVIRVLAELREQVHAKPPGLD